MPRLYTQKLQNTYTNSNLCTRFPKKLRHTVSLSFRVEFQREHITAVVAIIIVIIVIIFVYMYGDIYVYIDIYIYKCSQTHDTAADYRNRRKKYGQSEKEEESAQESKEK